MGDSSRPPVIYVDTSVYGDLLTKNGELDKGSGLPRWKVAVQLFDAINDGRVTLAASAMVEAEVACLGPYRDGGPDVHELVRGWFSAPATRWTDVDRFLARDAGRVARTWNQHRARPNAKLGGTDAVHLAAALRLGADYLMTQDEGFPIGHNVVLGLRGTWVGGRWPVGVTRVLEVQAVPSHHLSWPGLTGSGFHPVGMPLVMALTVT